MENKAFSAGDDDGEAQTKEIKFTTKQILMPCCWLSMCVLLLFYGPREPLHVPLPIPGPSSAVTVPSVRTATAKVTTTRLSWPCFARGFSLNEPSETSIPATKINSNHWHTHTHEPSCYSPWCGHAHLPFSFHYTHPSARYLPLAGCCYSRKTMHKIVNITFNCVLWFYCR